SGLVPLRAAVLLRHDGKSPIADEIAAFRGRLAKYNATHGLAVAHSNEFRDSAVDEAEVDSSRPIILLSPERLASLALRAGVGVQMFRIEVPLFTRGWGNLAQRSW
ncbi:MAG: restriction endonuclease, partial [Myxococcales bacterium]|nr:restriction endonuclease [Myxococcales bacterium]